MARSGVFLLLVLADGPAAVAGGSGPSLKEPEETEELGVLGRVEPAELGRRAGDGDRRPPWVLRDGEVCTGDTDPTALGGEGEWNCVCGGEARLIWLYKSESPASC